MKHDYPATRKSPPKKPGPKPKHGAYSMIRRKRLPKEFRSLHPYLKAVQEGLIEDLGGRDHVSVAQMLMIDRVIQGLGVLKLIERFIAEKGLLGQDRVAAFLLHDLSARYLSWDRKVTNHLQALGLDRKRIEDRPLTIEALEVMVQKEFESGDGEEAPGPDENMSCNGFIFNSGGLSKGDPGKGKGEGSDPLLGEEIPDLEIESLNEPIGKSDKGEG
jgi:hypothetical protein